MKISQKQKLIIAIVTFAIAGFIIYRSFFASSGTSANANGTGTAALTASSTSQEGQDILDLADKLNTMSIDSGFFDSPLFKSLKNFDMLLTPEPQGRPNPFEVIGVDNVSGGLSLSAVSTTSVKTQTKLTSTSR